MEFDDQNYIGFGLQHEYPLKSSRHPRRRRWRAKRESEVNITLRPLQVRSAHPATWNKHSKPQAARFEGRPREEAELLPLGEREIA